MVRTRRRNTSKRTACEVEGVPSPKKSAPRVPRGLDFEAYAQVARGAIASRLLTLVLCILFDYLLLDFDRSAGLHWPTCYSDLRAEKLHKSDFGFQVGRLETTDLTEENLSLHGEVTSTWGLDTEVHTESGGATIVKFAKVIIPNLIDSVLSGWRLLAVQSQDQVLAYAVKRAIVWDGVHFTRICQCGYEFDHQIAFLPLWPLGMRTTAKCINTLKSVLGRLFSMSRSLRLVLELELGEALTCAISGVALSNIFFVLSSVSLFRLSRRLGFSDKLAKRACLIYAFNPAAVFYSSIYTESMYNFLHFEALVHLFSSSNFHRTSSSKLIHGIVCTALLSAATFARSNGILNCVIILAVRLQFCVQTCVRKPERSARSWRRLSIGVSSDQLWSVLKQMVLAGIQCVAIVAPFYLYQISFQVYWCKAYRQDLSMLTDDKVNAQLELIGAHWCKGNPLLPKVYQIIQNQYWGVGFFKFYQISQIPNFCLALPIWVCTAFHVHKFVTKTMWLSSASPSSDVVIALVHLIYDENMFGQLALCSHWVLMCFVSVVIMNVQVSTRFLSTCAPLYLFTAKLTEEKESEKQLKWILGYFLTYAGLGCILFPNFYPFV